MNKNLKSCSKESYNLSHEGNPTLEEVRTSCLMRIADASETIAQNYNNLTVERDRYKKMFYEGQTEKGILTKKVSALKGVITRMKYKGAKNDE